MRPVFGVGVGVACVFLSACSTSDIILKKQMEMEARLEQMVQAKTAESARITQLTDELKELQSRVRGTAAALEDLKRNDRETAVALEAIGHRFDTITAVPSKIEVVNKEDLPEVDANHQELYMKAFGYFSANNFSRAIEEFEQYLEKYPDGDYAGNAQYWIGECLYSQRKFRESVEAYNRVVVNYPKSIKVPDAMLKLGYSLLALDETEKGGATLQSLVEQFPQSQAAAKARERMSSQQ